MNQLIHALDSLAAEIDAATPWQHPHAAELDAIPFATWLASNSDDEEARRIVGHYIAAGMFTKPSHSFSVLQAMLMIASAGKFEHLIDEGILLDERVAGGMQSVSQQIADELGPDVVHLSTRVRHLAWSDAGDGSPSIVAAVSDRVTVRARCAVVAIPPNLYSTIDYQPPLPRIQQVSHQHQSMGLVIKARRLRDTVLARARTVRHGFRVPRTDLRGLRQHRRGSPARNAGRLRGRRASRGDLGTTRRPASRRDPGVVRRVLRRRGQAAARRLPSDWGTEEFTRGAYGASWSIGGLSRWGHLQNRPVGPIFFASSDIQGIGYMHVDGGVRIGTDTANRINSALLAPVNG